MIPKHHPVLCDDNADAETAGGDYRLKKNQVLHREGTPVKSYWLL